LKLSELIQGVELLKKEGDLSGEVSSVCYDSRLCSKDSLFVAIPGIRLDGHHFIQQALKQGSRSILCERPVDTPAGVTVLRVKDSRQALGIVGKNFFRNPSAALCLVGVTGTNGKTTITYLLESVFRQAGYSPGVIGTINYRYRSKVREAAHTTPESFDLQGMLREMLDAGVSHVVMEVSSHALDQKRVDDCEFDAGIFTNLSQDHLDYHRTLEAYFQAKRRFFSEVLGQRNKGRQGMIINSDDIFGRRILQEMPPSQVLSFGLEGSCDIGATRFSFSLEGIDAEIRTPRGTFPVKAPLVGRYNLYNILAAAAAAHFLDIESRTVQAGLSNIGTIPGRLEKVSVAEEPAVFVDYAHTEDALKNVIENLLSFKKARLITVFGCGGDRDRGKRPLMGKVVVTRSDLSILTSDNPRTEDPLAILRQIEDGVEKVGVTKYAIEDVRKGFDGKGYVVIPDRREAIREAIRLAGPEDIVLVAGKGHETYQIIGTEKFPFDDRDECREALKSSGHGRGRWKKSLSRS
jgi:UDP-N-acetylmuramoyl-L-alanyl-D-glutamate--2,6-diaminopimelate ligase